jgi:hypothetical protein
MMLLHKEIFFLILFFFFINSQKIYDEIGSISDCLSGQEGILPNTCILTVDMQEKVANSTIDISVNESYVISGNSSFNYVAFSLIGNFIFKITRNYTIQNVNVYFFILLL